MCDRELLELAAKAAGYMVSIACCYEDGGLMCLDGEKPLRFSPLTDDGEALRLAVKLGISIGSSAYTQIYAERKHGIFASEPSYPEPYSATRRAIVRAAAEIGKSL